MGYRVEPEGKVVVKWRGDDDRVHTITGSLREWRDVLRSIFLFDPLAMPEGASVAQDGYGRLIIVNGPIPKVGRPLAGDRAMTAAERMALHRMRKKEKEDRDRQASKDRRKGRDRGRARRSGRQPREPSD